MLMCVVVAVPVDAFVSRTTHTVTIAAGFGETTFGSSTATCPKNQHALFGGVSGLFSGMHRTASNSWTVDGFNLAVPPPNSGTPAKLTSIAYCGYGHPASKATNTITIHKSGTVTVSCPAGTVLVGGGFAATPQSIFAVTQLQRVPKQGWRVSGLLVYGLTKQTALTAIAYCGPGPAPKQVSATIDHDGTARATCPVGKKLIFGGMVARGTPKIEGIPPAAATTLQAETQTIWSAGGYIYGGTLTALAYCR